MKAPSRLNESPPRRNSFRESPFRKGRWNSREIHAFSGLAAKQGIASTNLHTPRQIDIAGDRADGVDPADYTFKKNGKVMEETDSVFTCGLQKGGTGWRIIGWTWAKN